MIVGIKDAVKLVIISIMSCCAVFVSTLFLNYNIDIAGVESLISGEQAKAVYDAQKLTAVVISSVSGGCLLITTIIMLAFFIRNYIDTHKKDLGILKALGYSNLNIAKSFWVFGISILLGTAAGFAGAFAIMGKFYEVQNEDKLLPEFTYKFHPMLMMCLVILPAVVFAVLSIFYAALKLRTPVLGLIRDCIPDTGKNKKLRDTRGNGTFMDDLKRSTFRSRKSLVFFIIFGAFCFSAMTQMSFGVRDLASPMMGYMVLIIGLILAFVSLFLAVSAVIKGNTKTAAMMKVFGYSDILCRKAVLGGYRPMAYIGFAAGTFYQYFLLKICLEVIFKDMESVPELNFDVPVMLASLALFAVVYELFMFFGLNRIKNISIKEVMLES